MPRFYVTPCCGNHRGLAEIKEIKVETADTFLAVGHRGAIRRDCGAVFHFRIFGELLPQDVFDEAARRAARCDLFIVIGSSLIVYPAAQMPNYAVDAGAKLIIINLSPTPMDAQASVLIRAKAGEVMPRIVQRAAEMIGG